MNHLNRLLAPDIETLYVMASPQYSFVSSSGVKEIAAFGGNVDELVPAAVARRFRELFPEVAPAPLSAPRSRIRRSHGRTRSHRQARRPRAQREGRAADRPGADRPRGDLRHPRPDAGDDPRGDQAGALDRQGAPGDARRGEARVRPDPRGGARAGGQGGVADRDRQARRAPGAGDHRRGPPPGPRDAARDGGLGRRHPLDARGQPRQVPGRRQARPRAAVTSARRSPSSPASARPTTATSRTNRPERGASTARDMRLYLVVCVLVAALFTGAAEAGAFPGDHDRRRRGPFRRRRRLDPEPRLRHERALEHDRGAGRLDARRDRHDHAATGRQGRRAGRRPGRRPPVRPRQRARPGARLGRDEPRARRALAGAARRRAVSRSTPLRAGST